MEETAKIVSDVMKRSEVIVEKIVGKIEPIIQEMANSLGVGAEHLYSVLVKQAYIDGISNMIIVGIILGIAGFGQKYLRLWWKGVRERDFEEGELCGIIVVSVILTIVVCIAIPVNLIAGIKHLANPEYYAINEILSHIKK